MSLMPSPPSPHVNGISNSSLSVKSWRPQSQWLSTLSSLDDDDQILEFP